MKKTVIVTFSDESGDEFDAAYLVREALANFIMIRAGDVAAYVTGRYPRFDEKRREIKIAQVKADIEHVRSANVSSDNEADGIVRELCEWDATMGWWDNKVWERAHKYIDPDWQKEV
jgi:hypothetical protein